MDKHAYEYLVLPTLQFLRAVSSAPRVTTTPHVVRVIYRVLGTPRTLLAVRISSYDGGYINARYSMLLWQFHGGDYEGYADQARWSTRYRVVEPGQVEAANDHAIQYIALLQREALCHLHSHAQPEKVFEPMTISPSSQDKAYGTLTQLPAQTIDERDQT